MAWVRARARASARARARVRARFRARVDLRHGVALPYEPDLDKVAWLELGLGLGSASGSWD